MKHPFIKAVAIGLVAPVFFEHKAHLDISYVVSEPQPTMPLNLLSTATFTSYDTLSVYLDQGRVPK